ncbi:MAG TPA: MarR family winged helix-turn-helix transcriptional regulator [Puia sp.]|nr:MarR family winged helix-turn-helix transcriptional regulator [Puia sp.]
MVIHTTPRSVIPLLSSWEAYCTTFPAGDLPGFGRWLLVNSNSYPEDIPSETDALSIPTLAVYSGRDGTRGKVFEPGFSLVSPLASGTGRPSVGGEAGEGNEGNVKDGRTSENEPAVDATAQSMLLIARLHRILTFLSKPVLKKIGFPKDKEFAVLVQVALMNSPNKKEVCRELLMEGSTGVEITRRLAKRGLILEGTDENDRRSALLTLTEKGQKTLLQAYEQLGVLHTGFLDLFTDEEKLQLVSLLTRLDVEHTRRIANLLPIV